MGFLTSNPLQLIEGKYFFFFQNPSRDLPVPDLRSTRLDPAAPGGPVVSGTPRPPATRKSLGSPTSRRYVVVSRRAGAERRGPVKGAPADPTATRREGPLSPNGPE